LIRDIENNLEEWARLKNQLESVKNGDLQANLTKLGEERTLLKKRQVELELELKTIKSTLVTVDTEITKLEKEKNQQLKALEEERVRLLARDKK
jgi:predicted  nucleic acid-binding Zn-ribbon protein